MSDLEIESLSLRIEQQNDRSIRHPIFQIGILGLILKMKSGGFANNDEIASFESNKIGSARQNFPTGPEFYCKFVKNTLARHVLSRAGDHTLA
ncbi:MAG: hypothetical protein KDA78_00805 [Planctomycetaceae bacterium]|nr:hypothetical protein [Planctomycetaceae bacterium]